MASQNKISSWMWATEHGDTNGVTLDLHLGMIYWFDAIGCACGDNTAEQTLDQFREKGTPLGGVPDDVLAEIQDALARVE